MRARTHARTIRAHTHTHTRARAFLLGTPREISVSKIRTLIALVHLFRSRFSSMGIPSSMRSPVKLVDPTRIRPLSLFLFLSSHSPPRRTQASPERCSLSAVNVHQRRGLENEAETRNGRAIGKRKANGPFSALSRCRGCARSTDALS